MLVHCFVGCAQADVIAELRARGLWPERERPEWTPEQRRAWSREKHEIEAALPAALLWRRAAVIIAQAELDDHKAELFERTQRGLEMGEIFSLTRLVATLERLESGALVEAFRRHRQHDRHIAKRMVEWAHLRETAERAAVERYLREIA